MGDLIPEAAQSGWRGLVLGLFIMGIAAVMFEIGHWAGASEEREYWAPLEERPQRGWWRGWRWLELHVVDRIKHRARPPKRKKAEQAVSAPSSGRHRPQDAEKAPTPAE